MAMVTVIFGGETLGTHTIKHHPFVVGRDAANDIQIDNIGVSRKHCQFVYADKHFNIEDLESANGTQLHGQKIRMAPVRDGDEVKMGKYVLVFHQAPGEGPPPPKDGAGPGADLAAVMQGAPTEGPQAKAGMGDQIRTLMVDGALFQQAAPSAGPQRASDVASKFELPGKAGGGGSGKTLWIAVAVMGAIVLALVGVVVVLVLRKG